MSDFGEVGRVFATTDLSATAAAAANVSSYVSFMGAANKWDCIMYPMVLSVMIRGLMYFVEIFA